MNTKIVHWLCLFVTYLKVLRFQDLLLHLIIRTRKVTISVNLNLSFEYPWLSLSLYLTTYKNYLSKHKSLPPVYTAHPWIHHYNRLTDPDRDCATGLKQSSTIALHAALELFLIKIVSPTHFSSPSVVIIFCLDLLF